MPAKHPSRTIRPCMGPNEYPDLVEIWRSAVRATHDFLADADFARIESLLAPTYFSAVTLIVAERGGRPVGFAGVANGNLEMLFVSDEARGQGIGTRLLSEAITKHGSTRVDVNEQNIGAHRFYLSRGFEQVGRSPLDGDGHPYPLLHLTLPVLLRPYTGHDAAKTLAVFLDSVTQIASADYTADQVWAWARPDERDPETWHLEMSRRNSFVATVGGEVVGFSDVSSAGYIDMMFVAPVFQRQGIAGLLLAEATRQASDARASKLSANVSITARPFFERHGFQIEQVQQQTRAGVTLSNFSMRKSLLESG